MKVKKAIVLMNMGGPNNIDEVKVFLHNMFNDKHIISAPQPIRYFISHSIIKARLGEATSNYEKLGGKSPIIKHTKNLVRKLSKKIDGDVFYLMRYTPPFADEVVEKIKEYDEIIAIALYPHYSSTTTKSSVEDFIKFAKKSKIQNKVKIVDYFYENKLYNKAIVQTIKEALKKQNNKELHLIFSAHGLPQQVIDKGDVYHQHIENHVELIKDELKEQNIEFKGIHLAFQSRVGKMEWIKPYLEDKLKELKDESVLIHPISFCIDNSETEFELEVEYREIAKEIGIKKYLLTRCPNSNKYFIKALVKMSQ